MMESTPSTVSDLPPASAAGTAARDAPGGTDFAVGIGSISDVVFALALSIGSLILVDKTPQTGYALVQGIYYFGFSFLIVILVWVSFRRIVVVLPYETQGTLAVNVALLFCVAIEPFLFFVLVTTNTVGEDASMAFAVDIGVMMLLLSALDVLLLREERNNSQRNLPQDVVDRQGRFILLHLAFGSVYLVSAFPLFWTLGFAGTPIRYDVWYVALVWMFGIQVRWALAPRPKPASRNRGDTPRPASRSTDPAVSAGGL